MGVTAMRSFILLLVAFAFVEASNIVCKTGSSSKTVTVEDGDSFNYKTQKGKKYKGNADCTTNYIMGSSCAKMSLSCTKFNINNKDKKLCKKGDKMNIQANGKTKSYCKKKKPKVTSTGDISVTFTSDTKKHSSGATCKVSCMEAATSETTTTMPTTTPGNEPIETITRVRLELFHGQHDAGEPLSFDGQKITLPMDPQFNPSKPVKVVIHGWGQANLDGNGDVIADNDDYPHSFNQLYKSNGMDYTVLGVHWVPRDGWLEHLQTESSADAANTLGLLMRTLYNDFNIDTSQVHVIGFSMGTVVTSKTAKFIQQLGLPRFGRLTLLDPCPFHQASVISKTDAKFVEAIHTSSQDICSETPLAHVDYYPNGGDAQPCGSDSCGCPDGSLVCGTCFHGTARCVNFLGPDWVTNHMRAVELYRESIGRPSAFLSWRCSGTYEDFVAGDRVCIKNDQQQEVPMGEHSMDQGRPVDGLYFLTTSGESP